MVCIMNIVNMNSKNIMISVGSFIDNASTMNSILNEQTR